MPAWRAVGTGRVPVFPTTGPRACTGPSLCRSSAHRSACEGSGLEGPNQQASWGGHMRLMTRPLTSASGTGPYFRESVLLLLLSPSSQTCPGGICGPLLAKVVPRHGGLGGARVSSSHPHSHAGPANCDNVALL